MAFSSESKVFLVSERGEIIGSSVPDQTGRNIADCFGHQKQEENWQVLKEKMLKGKESGGFVHHCDLNKENKTEKTIATYTKIRPNGNPWTLFIGLPFDEVNIAWQPLRITQVCGLVLILTGILTLSLIFIISLRLTEKRSYKNGFSHACQVKDIKSKKKKIIS